MLSQKRKMLMKVGGFTFRQKVICNGKVTWVCSTHKTCKAILHTIGSKIVKIQKEHNHQPSSRLRASYIEVNSGTIDGVGSVEGLTGSSEDPLQIDEKSSIQP